MDSAIHHLINDASMKQPSYDIFPSALTADSLFKPTPSLNHEPLEFSASEHFAGKERDQEVILLEIRMRIRVDTTALIQISI